MTADGTSSRVRDARVRELEAKLAAAERQCQHFELRSRMLEQAVNTISTGVTVADMEGKILYVNHADARMHGYAVGELLGENVRRYAAMGGLIDDELEPGEPWTRERIDATKDGFRFPVRLTSRRLLDSRQRPLAIVTLCEDMRERKRIDEALVRHDLIIEALGMAAERFLAGASWQKVLDRLGRATGVDLIYVALLEEAEPFAPDRFFLSWETPAGAEETAFSESLGLPARVELFARWEDRLREGETLHGRVDELSGEDRQVLASCGVQSFAVVPILVDSVLKGYLSLEDGDPDRLWTQVELYALQTVARTFAASLQHREAEKALQVSEEKYRDLLDNANDLIQSVSPDGRFQYVNRAWLETLGYSAEEAEALRLWDVVKVEEPDHEQVVQHILSGDGESRVEAVFVTRRGEEITVEGSVNCRYVDGLPVSTRGIFRDVTERKRAERIVQEFVSTVSHELRTPLTSIIASLGLLDSGQLTSKPDRVGELVSMAHRNSQRLLRLINNLLDLQMISAGKMSFTIEPLDAHELLAESLDGIRAFAGSQEISLRIAEAGPGLRVLADRERLLQVLENLLSNAIKFSPDDAEVTVAAVLHDGRVRMAVGDRGPGIPEEFRDRLFERFTQFDSGGRRRAGGSGLGLSIALGLVEGMGGAMTLDTEVGEGTTFYVDLPWADAGESGE